jgi:hypothetical protein
MSPMKRNPLRCIQDNSRGTSFPLLFWGFFQTARTARRVKIRRMKKSFFMGPLHVVSLVTHVLEAKVEVATCFTWEI